MDVPDPEFRKLDAMLQALSRISTGEEDPGLGDARCPRCNASAFAKVSDLYDAAVRRLHDPDAPPLPATGGLTEADVISKLGPPGRRSAIPLTIVVGALLEGSGGYVYWRFGDTYGQLALIVGGVITLVFFMTRLRRSSDEYYKGRAKWRHLYLCTNCGQRVSG